MTSVKTGTNCLRQSTDTSLNPDANEVIPDVTKGVRNVLEAASKQPSVKRFVLTSSSSAAYFANPSQKVIITEGMHRDFKEHSPSANLYLAVFQRLGMR
jgi:nucleoside-diphosphate-sugar epimerase